MMPRPGLIIGKALLGVLLCVARGAGADDFASSFRSSDVPPFAAGHSPNGLAGWRVPRGVARVLPFAASDGTPLLSLSPSSEVHLEFSQPEDDVFWFVTRLRTSGGLTTIQNLPTSPLAAAIGFRHDLGLVALNGNGVGGGSAVTLGVPLDGSIWHDIVLRQNYTRQSYDVYIDGVLRQRHLGFRDHIAAPSGISLTTRSETASVSSITVQRETPAGLAYLRGDVRIDGILSAADIVTMVNSLNGGPALTLQQAANADINDDGVVNATDRDLLAQIIVGQDVP